MPKEHLLSVCWHVKWGDFTYWEAKVGAERPRMDKGHPAPSSALSMCQVAAFILLFFKHSLSCHYVPGLFYQKGEGKCTISTGGI